MTSGAKITAVAVIVIVGVVVTLFTLRYNQSRPAKVSRFGEYRGYSEAVFDGYVRRSDYLTLKDGKKLAYDVLLPTRDGAPASDPLPVLLTHTPYLRAMKVVDDGKIIGSDLFGLNWFKKAFLWLRSKLSRDGHILDQAFRNRWLRNLVKHGYVVVAVERAGTGASFGIIHPSFDVAAREANEIIGWIAAQPWCDGNVGMFGDSYEAMTQYAAASVHNSHLKAIFPCSSSFDMYDAIIYPGGVYNKAFTSILPRATAVLEKMVLPVDGDKDGKVLAQVLEKRKEMTLGNASGEAFKQAPHRDSRRSEGLKLWDEMGLYKLLDRINGSGVPVYNSTGWYDIFTRDSLLWHGNLTGPRRLHIRPLFHDDLSQSKPDLDFGAEVHRWFDYWLKGIDNGIIEEPPIYYYVMGAPKAEAWRTSDQWPLASQEMTRFYLADGPTGSVASINDGFLRRESPRIADASDAYTVDYTTTTGIDSRWYAVVGGGSYPDMRANDERALTYTTPPLEADVEVTGHPVAHIWITTEVPDVDMFMVLEEVDSKRKSTYITEGNLRASHRVLSAAPFNNLGLPYSRSRESDLAPIPAGEPVGLVFDLLPISNLFDRGSRIRVTITCADADNFDTPILDPVPEIRVLKKTGHESFVELPIIPNH